MKKIFFVIILILHTNIFAEEKQNESRVAKYVMENIQKGEMPYARIGFLI